MRIQLSEHFTYGRLLRFAFPSMCTMLFTSVYSIVDGYFVSNYVGKSPFAALNFIMPALMILGAVGTMLGTGGSALVAKTLGEGDRERANRLFSLFVYGTFLVGAAFALLGILLLPAIARLMGAEGELLANSVLYGRIFLLAMPAFMLQFAFQSFFVTAEKPQLGFWFTLGAGVLNMVLDALFMGVFRWGLVGAAAATAVSQTAGGLLPALWFFRPNDSLLRLGRTRYEGRAVAKACGNGASEFVSSIAMSVVGMLYNIQLLRYAGEDGIAAYGVLMYVSMVFMAIFMGYAMGTAPIVGYHYGAGDRRELGNLLRKGLVLIAAGALCMFAAGELLAQPLSRLFVGYDEGLLAITLRGFRIFSFVFLPAGFSILGSSFFTALNNGLVSALISFLRTVVFEAAAVLLLPLLLGLDGVWLAGVAAEAFAILLCLFFLVRNAPKYGYFTK
jgi:putative MATE family efflux protein